MTVTPGLLDRRLTLWERREGGADGFSRPVYVRIGEYWGRLDEIADDEQIPLSPQGHIESQTRATATVADYVVVPKFGIVREGNGPLYFTRGTILLRALRCQRITLEAIDPTEFSTFAMFEDVDVRDGYHLVTDSVVP